MREIKFRAWDKEKSAMILHDELNKRNGIMDFLDEYINPYAEMIKEFESRPRVYMQYTGSKDKNGTEIYESDYVRGVHRGFEVGILVEVTFLNGCFMFGNFNAHEFFNMHQEIEIIGNIYENPELLEGAN